MRTTDESPARQPDPKTADVQAHSAQQATPLVRPHVRVTQWGFVIGDAGAIGLIVGWKLATLFVALIAAGMLDPAYAYPGAYDFTFANAFERLESALRLNWDGRHYLALANVGYNVYPTLAGFFPLYPLLIDAANRVFGDSLVSALVIANATSGVALYFFLPNRAPALVGRDGEPRARPLPRVPDSVLPQPQLLGRPVSAARGRLFLRHLRAELLALGDGVVLAADLSRDRPRDRGTPRSGAAARRTPA